MTAATVFTVEKGSEGWRVTAGPSGSDRVDLVAWLDMLTHAAAALAAAIEGGEQ